MRLHGISRDVWDRFETGASWEYDIIAPGFKYNMPDTNAAIGIHQLKKVEQFRDQRQKIAEIYSVFQRCVSLPMFSAMTEAQLDYVIGSIKEILS